MVYWHVQQVFIAISKRSQTTELAEVGNRPVTFRSAEFLNNLYALGRSVPAKPSPLLGYRSH